MLFQPTNITPSLLGTRGNGTIDVLTDLVVSWQVNGNSPMTKFTISIYENDTESTLVYTTGEKTDGCPFYSVDSEGNVKFFRYTITSQQMIASGMTNGKEYKLVITQYWSATDYITQSSASAFNTRKTPTLHFNNITQGDELDSRLYTFVAEYAQEQGDSIEWVRWQIAEKAIKNEPFFDTDNIYGATELQVSYDGFFTDSEYSVKCTVQTSSGIEITTDWVDFSVYYETIETTNVLIPECVKNTSAVKLSWSALTYIAGIATGSYQVANKRLRLSSGATVIWQEVNGSPMHFNADWTLYYKGILPETSTDIEFLKAEMSENTLYAKYNGAEIDIYYDDIILATLPEIQANSETIIIISKDKVLYSNAHYTGGLMPGNNLYPAETLYPKDNTEYTFQTGLYQLDYTQDNITKLELKGEQITQYLQVDGNNITQNDIDIFIATGIYEPERNKDTYFLALFVNGLNAGTTLETGEAINGYALYRREENNNQLEHIGDFDYRRDNVLDYSVKNNTEYTYYLFPQTGTTYKYKPYVSHTIVPFFWDYVLLSCVKSNKTEYLLENEFIFRNNISTSPVSNNNEPNILINFTKYPTVQKTPQNYKSGQLSALIGQVELNEISGKVQYIDTRATRDRIYQLSIDSKDLFLKNRKGDLLKVEISSAIEMATSDNTKEQIQTMALSWVEVDDTNGISIIK